MGCTCPTLDGVIPNPVTGGLQFGERAELSYQPGEDCLEGQPEAVDSSVPESRTPRMRAQIPMLAPKGSNSGCLVKMGTSQTWGTVVQKAFHPECGLPAKPEYQSLAGMFQSRP
ncbi:unnamed protein product [Natator depressus]